MEVCESPAALIFEMWRVAASVAFVAVAVMEELEWNLPTMEEIGGDVPP